MWHGRTAALGTSHGKEEAIGPILLEGLGLQVVVPIAFDSDKFGTFTREKKRKGNQLEAARAKARAAMAATGLSIGIASEGSFGNSNAHSFLPMQTELIVMIDTLNDIEIHGVYKHGRCVAAGQWVRSVEEAHQVAARWQFPSHGIIVRRSPAISWGIDKTITSETELAARVRSLLRIPFVRRVYMETDMRAHRNPTRMEAIAEAARDLVTQATSLCPRCSTPGFSADTPSDAMASCAACGRASEHPSGAWYACTRCGYREERSTAPTVNPAECNHCNP